GDWFNFGVLLSDKPCISPHTAYTSISAAIVQSGLRWLLITRLSWPLTFEASFKSPELIIVMYNTVVTGFICPNNVKLQVGGK
ncbi:MAG: hypothetical protein ACRCWC_08105, partial [Plesiomonas shigelloides]